MNKFVMGMALAGIFAVGCGDKVDDTGTTGGEEETNDDTGTAGADPTFTVTWGSADVSLAITDCDACAEWGIAETGTDADPWTGEDCLNGYFVESTGETLSYCHGISATGATLTYGGDALDLAEGSETVFSESTPEGVAYEGLTTHYVGAGADCYVWGDDVGYYSSYGCTEI